MLFKNVRRQKFLDETHAKEFDEEVYERIQDFAQKITDENLVPDARSSFAWFVASDSIKLIILRYTAGYPLAELTKEVPSVISAFDTFIPYDKPRPNVAYTLEIAQHEAYVYVMWLLALCQLLGHPNLVPVVLGWLNPHAEFSRGTDGLFEAIVEKLTGTKIPVERVLLHPEPYRPLAKATATEDPSERPALVKAFLEIWYKNMKPCNWYGTHTEGFSYFGYWAFEAALVTYLWDIDDTSYRDHLVYPKDLVDFARKNFPYQGPLQGSGGTINGRCEGGQPCPREGYWFTPAKPDSRRHFVSGETMPEFDSKYDATIWQWDEANQTLSS